MTARRRLSARRSTIAQGPTVDLHPSVNDASTVNSDDGSSEVAPGSIDATHVGVSEESAGVGTAADASRGSTALAADNSVDADVDAHTDDYADDDADAHAEDYDDAASSVEGRDDTDGSDDGDEASGSTRRRRRKGRGGAGLRTRARLVNATAFGVLPALALILGGGFGYMKWYDTTARETQLASVDAVATARDTTVAMLAYQPDTVEASLRAVRDRLTGSFRDDYTRLVNEVVVPGAKEKKVKTLVSVPAAATISASPDHAVVMVYINQNVTMGDNPPTDTASAVKITLEKVGERWLISAFEPI